MLSHRRAWLAGGWLLVCLVVILSLIPSPSQPLPFSGVDKLEHVFAYASLSLWFCQIYLSARPRMVTLTALIALGVGLEFVQGWTGYRSFEVLDMAANSVGVLAGFLLTLSPLGYLFVSLEKTLRKIYGC